MKQRIVFAAGAAVTLASTVLFGSPTAAAAPDVSGETYADASELIEGTGGTAVVATRTGNTVKQDDCIVTNAWDAPFTRDVEGEFEHAEGEVMLSLNCNNGHATVTQAGASVASPEGRKSKRAEEVGSGSSS